MPLYQLRLSPDGGHCPPGQGPSRKSRVSHCQRLVCVSSSGFPVCAMGRVRLGPPRQGHDGRSRGRDLQVPTKPVTPCSFAALRPGPRSVVLNGGSSVGQVLHLGYKHAQTAWALRGRSCSAGLGPPPQHERCRGLCWEAGSPAWLGEGCCSGRGEKGLGALGCEAIGW